MAALDYPDLLENARAMTLGEAEFALQHRRNQSLIYTAPQDSALAELLLEHASNMDPMDEGDAEDVFVTAAALLILAGPFGAEIWEAVETEARRG